MYLSLIILAAALTVFGKKELVGKIPIGNFPEKDIYYTYDDPNIKPTIIDSRWSINGRSDLVEYNNRNFLKEFH